MLHTQIWKNKTIAMIALSALASWLTLEPAAVLAHSNGPMVNPAHGSRLSSPPGSLDFAFMQPVRLTAVRLYEGTEDEIELRGARSLEPVKQRRIDLPTLAPGAYRVEWRALSAEGHPVDGAFSFTVAPTN